MAIDIKQVLPAKEIEKRLYESRKLQSLKIEGEKAKKFLDEKGKTKLFRMDSIKEIAKELAKYPYSKAKAKQLKEKFGFREKDKDNILEALGGPQKTDKQIAREKMAEKMKQRYRILGGQYLSQKLDQRQNGLARFNMGRTKSTMQSLGVEGPSYQVSVFSSQSGGVKGSAARASGFERSKAGESVVRGVGVKDESSRTTGPRPIGGISGGPVAPGSRPPTVSAGRRF